MTDTCCLEYKNIPCPHEISCRTEPLVSWCKQKPNERHKEAEYPKTNKDLCNGCCEEFIR